ncbi:MAG: hypothetical protein GXP54_01770, partial [Deltaproteobacteria bacterium]|nr:hypothetical protein [Deltaproteobacteria bacterium]
MDSDIDIPDSTWDGADLPAMECADSTGCAPEKPICKMPEGVCVECLVSMDCGAADMACVNNACVIQVCEPYMSVCIGDLLEICNADGTGKTTEDCSELGLPCLEGECG